MMTFLSENLSTLLSKPHVQSKWDANLVGDLEQVAIVFQEFGDFLEKHKQDETKHQACLYPARQVEFCMNFALLTIVNNEH